MTLDLFLKTIDEEHPPIGLPDTLHSLWWDKKGNWDSQKLLGPVKYEDGSIVIETAENIEQPALPEATLDKRVIARMAFQEAKKQSNIEQITQLLQLVEKTPADPKYISKFASLFRREGITIQSGLVVEWLKDNIRYINLQDVPAESDNENTAQPG